MKFDVAQSNGKVYLTFEDSPLLSVIMSDIEDLIKSTAYAGNYESTQKYIEMLLRLRKAKAEMKGEEND